MRHHAVSLAESAWATTLHESCTMEEIDDEVDLSRLSGQEQARAPEQALERDMLGNNLAVAPFPTQVEVRTRVKHHGKYEINIKYCIYKYLLKYWWNILKYLNIGTLVHNYFESWATPRHKIQFNKQQFESYRTPILHIEVDIYYFMTRCSLCPLSPFSLARSQLPSIP